MSLLLLFGFFLVLHDQTAFVGVEVLEDKTICQLWVKFNRLLHRASLLLLVSWWRKCLFLHITCRFFVLLFKEFRCPLLYIFKCIKWVNELGHSFIGMWCSIQAITFNKECHWQVVKDILFELIGRVLCQYLKESRLFRKPAVLVPMIEYLFRFRVTCSEIVPWHLWELESFWDRLPLEMTWRTILCNCITW